MKCRRCSSPRGDAGHTLVEALLVCALVAALGVPAVALLQSGLNHQRTEAAARFLAARLDEARSRAIRSHRAVGLRFDLASAPVRFELVADGNGNGLRTDELQRGVDVRVAARAPLDEYFPRTTLGIAATVPGIDGEETLEAGTSPIRVGPSGLVSFSPMGTSTSGTVYVRGPDTEQFAVRILGATGRIRIWRFDPARGRWERR